MSQAKARLTPKIIEPFCHWDGASPRHYEMWSFSLKPQNGAPALWFEYALEVPARPDEAAPRGMLVAAAFNRRNRTEQFFIRRASPLKPLSDFSDDLSAFEFGDGVLHAGGLKGALRDGERHLEWDLRFVSGSAMKGGLRRLGLPPFVGLRVSGAVTINGRELKFDGTPGCLSRRWGRQPPLECVRVHCEDFEAREGTVFEAHAVRQAAARLPAVLALMLSHEGESHRFTRLRMARQWRRNLGVGYWTFAAMNRRVYIEGSAQCRLRDMFPLDGEDAEGRPMRMRISRLANLKIRLFRRVHGFRYRYVETLRAHATAHLETCRRFPIFPDQPTPPGV